jgi:hypothetical protein
MALSPNYRFLLLISLLAALVSALLNMIINNIMWSRYNMIPLWGHKSITSYLYIFSILFSFILVFFVTKVTRNALRTKQLMPLQWHYKSQTIIDNLPSKTVPRAFILAMVSCLMASLTIMLLDKQGLTHMFNAEFYAFSTFFFLLQSVAIAIMAIYRAMGDTNSHATKEA